MSHVPSPGNTLTPDIPPMRLPHLEHVYRLVADMLPAGYEIPNIKGTGESRSVVHIAGGTVTGPRIKGKVLENSGADWAVRVRSKRVSSAFPPCRDYGSLDVFVFARSSTTSMLDTQCSPTMATTSSSTQRGCFVSDLVSQILARRSRRVRKTRQSTSPT